MKKLKFKFIWLLIGVLSVLLVVYFSLAKFDDSPSTIPHLDKLLHAGIYTYLGWYFSQIFTSSKRLIILVALLAMGILIEFLQKLTGYRSFELQDIAANIFGITLGVFVFHKIYPNLIEDIDHKI
ncbi:MAG: VanZ family protein [Bacteriovoracaceae bacterium]|nr:VanZ family protein [Bacteriovoracaceae bacterium]